MTPKQKEEHLQNIEMLRFLGYKKDYSNYNDVHLRKIIERRKQQVLKTLGVEIGEE